MAGVEGGGEGPEPTFRIAGAARSVHDDGRGGGAGRNLLQVRQVVVASRLAALGHHLPEGDQLHIVSAKGLT
jgi:hypothetical protein